MTVKGSNKFSLELVFIHIHKTGGKSISKSLQEIYQNQYFRYNRHQLRQKGLDHIDPSNDPFPKGTRVLSGHLKYKEVEPILDPTTRIITWLRHPIDRLVSNYYWRKQLNMERPGNDYPINDPNITLEQFADLEINQNRISKFLEGIELEDLFFIGLMEQLEEDLHLLASKLDWPRVPVFHVNKNRIKPEKPAIRKRLEEKLISLNQKDIELYRKALELRQ
ncbi:MAG: sulfotransferase family 2 domain-containing protein [Saprospiraceae bacterium]|nr:sulfotransferase family 2 domain-containing protein [Saprospiraceae bacterium]